MEREAKVLNVAFFALIKEVIPQAEILEEMSPWAAEIVKEVEVEISSA